MYTAEGIAKKCDGVVLLVTSILELWALLKIFIMHQCKVSTLKIFIMHQCRFRALHHEWASRALHITIRALQWKIPSRDHDSSLKNVYPGTCGHVMEFSTGHVMESGQSQASIEPCIHNAPMQGLTSTHTHSTIHLQSWIRSKHTCLILRIIILQLILG